MWAGLKSNVLQGALQRCLAAMKASGSTVSGRPLVVGLLSTRTGIGYGARLILKSFQQMGVEAAYLDVSELFAAHKPVIDLPPSLADDGRGPVIFHINPPELLPVLRAIDIPNFETRYRAAIWAWEQSTVPPLWHKRQAWVDEIWASSQFLTQTFAQLSDVPTHYMPYPVPSERAVTAPKSDKTLFKVLAAFNPHSVLARKNPLGAIAAFQAAFPNDPSARLTLQSGAALTGEQKNRLLVDDRIDVIETVYSDDEMTELMLGHDVFLSLHRSEGYGLSIAKALSLGLPSVFTAYSGPEDFTGSPSAYPMAYDLVDVTSDTPIYATHMGQWAQPDINQAASMLQEIRAMGDVARSAQKQQAQRWWRDNLSGPRFAQNLTKTSLFQRLSADDQAAILSASRLT